MGSSHSAALNGVTQSSWNFAMDRNIWLSATHIPGKENQEADTESRKTDIYTEWMLNPLLFQQACSHFAFHPEVDLFASRLNTQLKKFVSYRPDPDCFHVNAFSISWENINIYCFSFFIS